MPEVILFEPDPEIRLMLRSLLERDGVTVNEVDGPEQLKDVARASKAQALLATAATRQTCEKLLDEVARGRPDMDVLTPMSYTAALLDGAAQREQVAELARDSILLLAVVAEDAAKRPPMAEKLARLAELTALRLGLARSQVEQVATVASLVALGPSLAAFRFGVPPDDRAPAGKSAAGTITPSMTTVPTTSLHGGKADGGVGRDLQAAIAAAAALRSPWDLRGVLEALEERFDGRGRPRGLEGKRIPIAARIVAVAREYAQSLAAGEEVVATELVRARAGAEFDPKVCDAFFRALRDESYLDRFTSGKRGPKVLVVDGDPSALAVAELRLGAAGFAVSVCEDGAKAAELIAADTPDVLIADTVLPRLDGISLLLKLKRDPKSAQLPVYFTSTRTDAALLNKALKLGAKDVLAKPVNFDVLVAKLRTLQQAGVGSAASGSKAEAVQGDLAEMPLTDFFQVLSLGRKTVKITVNSSAGTGMIFFERGSPIAAATRDTRGFDAFATIVTWSQGTFSLTFGEVAPERNLDRGLENMILQLGGARGSGGGASSSSVGGSPSRGFGSQHDNDMGPGVVFAPPPVDEDNPYGAPPPAKGAGKDIEFDLG